MESTSESVATGRNSRLARTLSGKFGIIPELIGRLPIITPLNSLGRDDLVRILTEPKNAMTRQYQAMFRYDGVDLEFEQGAFEAIADKAVELGIGARGLRSVLEGVMTDLMFNTPSDDTIERIVITADAVKGGASPVIVRKSAENTRTETAS